VREALMTRPSISDLIGTILTPAVLGAPPLQRWWSLRRSSIGHRCGLDRLLPPRGPW
jgi:hypothetical protein